MAFALFLIGFSCFISSHLHAGHVSGVGLTYECMNGCTVRVHFRAYRDCSSPITNISPINTLVVQADSGCIAPTQITPWVNVSSVEVTPVCPGTPTGCNTPGATIPGVMEHYWQADFDFCSANCSTYTFYWQTCCRNQTNTNLYLPAMTAMSASSTFNPFLTPCNSTPVFNTPPILTICQGQNYFFSMGATDPDGDSLVYALGPCGGANGQPVTYLSYTSPTQPLGPDWIVDLDSTSGNMNIRPDLNGPFPGSLQVGAICIFVQEWRNGQLINTIVRDFQINVIPCTPNDPPTTLGVSNLTGAIANNQFSVSTCLGATVCFDLRTIDSDLLQTQTVWWDQSLAPLGAQLYSALNPLIQDTIVGQLPQIRFCWTPPQAGSFNFSLMMRDDACPIYGISQYTFQIIVTEIGVTATDSVTDCKEVGFCGTPLSGLAPFTYQWTGPGGLTNNPGSQDSCLVHSYPSSGSFPFTLTLHDALGCTAVWNDTLIVPNNVVADAGPDMSTCANQPTVIGLPPQVSQTLTYAWGPPIGLTNATLPQPTVTLSNNTQLPMQQAYVVSIRDTVTYCVDTDTMVMTVYPIPASPFNMPDTICQNATIGLIYTGWNGPLATYDWTFDQGSPPSTTGQGPHQVFWTTPGLHEVALTVTENGCSSPTERDTIFVRTNPTSTIAPVAGQCLVGNSFNFQNLGVFGPGATHNWVFWPNANPSSSTTQNPTGIVFATPGPKLVTLTTSDGTCTSTPDSVAFTVFADPNAVWYVVGGVQCFNGNSHQFVAQAGNGPTAQYNWTFQNGNPATSTDTLPVVSFASPGPQVVTLSVTANGCTATHTDTIMVWPEPLVAAGNDTSFCEGEGGVGLQAQATGGIAPYYYTWSCTGISGSCGIDSTNDNDPHVNPSASATFVVQVTDVNGCTSPSDSVRVTILPKPHVNAGPDLNLCGLNAPCQILLPSVSGVGPFTFEWFPATGLNDSSLFNPCARPTTTTIYTLVATDLGTGCTSDYNTLDTASSVTVNVYPVPIADAGPDIHTCPGDTVQIQGVGYNAGPSYQYQWTPFSYLSSPHDHNPLAWPPATTTYTLVVVSNGCASVADTLQVLVHTMPSVDAGWNQEICLGETTLLDATAGGDSTAQYTFHWTNAISLNDPFIEDPLATPASSTTYFVVATSNWGCSSPADSVTITLRPTPIAHAGADTTVCFGAWIHLDGSYYYGATDSADFPNIIRYTWQPGGALSDSTQPQPLFQPQVSGMYHLSVDYQLCHTEDSVLILVVPDLNAQILADTSIICQGDSLPLTASGGLGSPNYQWFPAQFLDRPYGQSNVGHFPDSAQITLIVQESGCADTATLDLSVIPSPEAAFIHSPEVGCAPLTLSLMENSSMATAYVWDFGDGSPVSNMPIVEHVYTEPGTYLLNFQVSTTGACRSQANTLNVIVEEPPTPMVSSLPDVPAVLYLPHPALQLHQSNPAASATVWDFGDGFQSLGQEAQHVYREPGTYFIVVHTQNALGCMATDSLGPYIVALPDLFIPNVFSPNGDGINDIFQVQYTGDQPYDLQILDRWGEPIFATHSKLAHWDGKLKGQPAPDGAYYYHLRIGTKEYTGEVTLVR